MTKNKGGRPKKVPAEKLKYRVSFMLQTGDYYTLKARAEAAGLRLAEFAWFAVTGRKIEPRVTVEQAGWLRQLSGMCNNLNQLARLAHKSGYNDIRHANINLGRDIYRIAKQIRDGGKDHKG
jgi:hypothetical protein